MSTNKNRTFRTKTGFCHVLHDKILFSKNEDIEKALNETTENPNPISMKLILGLIFIGPVFIAYNQYSKSVIDKTTFIITLLILPIIYFLISKFLKLKTISQIERNKISRIKLYKSLGGLTYTKFVIYFEAENKKRMATAITIPDQNIYGKRDIDNAIKIFTEENLLETDN